jgi:hypothetical protein
MKAKRRKLTKIASRLAAGSLKLPAPLWSGGHPRRSSEDPAVWSTESTYPVARSNLSRGRPAHERPRRDAVSARRSERGRTIFAAAHLLTSRLPPVHDERMSVDVGGTLGEQEQCCLRHLLRRGETAQRNAIGRPQTDAIPGRSMRASVVAMKPYSAAIAVRASFARSSRIAACIAIASRLGEIPNMRPYSRLNWDGLS